MKKTLLACTILLPVLSQAQVKIGLNPGIIEPGSVLELEHPNKALYLNRVSLVSTTDLTTVPNPKAGMTLYNTNTSITGTALNPALVGGAGLYVFNGTSWVGASNEQVATNFWNLTGNAAINPATNFLGTTDASPLSLRTRDSLRALFRADGTMAFTNATPLYADNIAEFRLNNIGGSTTNGEQNQGLNVLGQALNGANQSIAIRGRNNVASGSVVNGLRGVQGNANVEGTANGGVTAGYFNTSLKNGGALGAAASMTGIASDVDAAAGSSSAATNTFTGGRFGVLTPNAPNARTVGVLSAAAGSTTSNIGVIAVANDPGYAGYIPFIGALPAGYSSAVVGFNPSAAANNYAGYFVGRSQNSYSSANRVMAEPGNNIPAGRELFGGHTTISGTDGAATASATITTLRAQVNQASSVGNNVRVQGALNEASSSGAGLGAQGQPQATGVTGLADYVGSTDAPASDFIVGMRGAAYTATNKTNGLNVVGQNFAGNFYRSVGGYFAPSNGSDANLGVVAQVGGTSNQAWKDLELNGTNAAVVAMDYNAPATPGHAALITRGPVRMSLLNGTGTDLLTIDPTTGAIGSIPAPVAAAPAWNLNGNAGLTTNDFIGTTDAQQFAVRTNNVQRALFRPDGSIAMGNGVPVYSDTKFEINLADVGGAQTNGEQNGGVNVLASSLDASALSVAVRGRMDVASGKTIGSVRGVQGNVSVSGAASGGVTGGYFNAAMKTGGSLGSSASVTGVAADAEAGSGTGTTASTNSFIGGRFGANSNNAAVSRATGVFAAANNSTTANVGVYALANDPTYTNYLVFNNGLPAGFSAAVVGFNPANANNNYAGYFYGKNKAQYSSTARVIAEPGNAIAPGTELFGGQTTIGGTDGANASASPTTLRAQLNQSNSVGNNVRVQGSLNEASSSGQGLGQYNQPQANGATGLGDYVGSSDAPVTDYIVGLRGAAYTAGSRTNGLNVVGVNFGGKFYRSVGGYFAPGEGSDANLGIVAQTGGTTNSGWRDAQFAGKNISVAAINTGTTANDYAGYFTGSNNATTSSVLRAVNNAGVVADGADLFASHNSITGTNAGAVGTPSTLRAQYNSATSASNNLRVQGALNEASTSGRGLGANATPQATGVTGLADYTGTTDAPTTDFLVGVRGATYTSSNKTNGLNVVGVNFSGNYYRSVGGYFAPTSGSDANLGVVAQTGGTENAAWKDADLAGLNVGVAAIDYNTTGTNHLALYTEGPVRMRSLPVTGSATNVVSIDPTTGQLGRYTIPSIVTGANNGLSVVSNNARLGGNLVTNTTINTTNGANNYALNVSGGGNFNYTGTGNVGVGTATPASKLSVNGSFGTAITISSASILLTDVHHTVILQTNSGLTVTLPNANLCAGRIYRIVNTTNLPSATSASYTSYVTGSGSTVIPANNRIVLQSDGSNWYQID